MMNDNQIEITIDNTSVTPSSDTIVAMEQFLKDGTVPLTYLGDISSSVDTSSLSKTRITILFTKKGRPVYSIEDIANMKCPYPPEPGY
jgi:hypothetical protein